MNVYIVNGNHDYESSHVLKVFSNEEKANQFLEQCKSWLNAEPEYPGFFVHNNEDPRAAEYYAEMDRWNQQCPAESNYDNFFIVTMELIE